MPKIRQHIPAFITGIERSIVEFTTLADLVAIPFVASFSSEFDFHQFSLADDMLMAEYDAGRHWFVVGFLDGDLPSLPEWRPVRSRVHNA